MPTCVAASPPALCPRVAARRTRPRLRAASAASHEPDALFDALRAWVHARGGYLSPALRLSASEHGGRELRVAVPVLADTLLASLPRSCCLCLDDEEERPAGLQLPWPARMALLMLAAMLDSSGFSAVVACWPPSTVPVGILAPWPVLDLLSAALPDVRDTAAGLQLRLEEAKAKACPVGVPAADFEWAVSLALSRVARPSLSSLDLLAPVFDLANHEGGDQAALQWVWCPAAEALHVHAARDLEPGPARVSYGDHGNTDLWLAYGFTLPDNPKDTIVLWPDMLACAEWVEEHMTGGGGANTAAELQVTVEEELEALRAGRHGELLGPLLRWTDSDAAGARAAVHRRAQQLVDALDGSLASLDGEGWRGGEAQGAEFLPSVRCLLTAKRLLLHELLAHTALA